MEFCSSVPHANTINKPKRRKYNGKYVKKSVEPKLPRPKRLLFPKRDTRIGPNYQADIMDVLPNFVRHHSSNYLTCPPRETLIPEKDIRLLLEATRIEFHKTEQQNLSGAATVNQGSQRGSLLQTPIALMDKTDSLDERTTSALSVSGGYNYRSSGQLDNLDTSLSERNDQAAGESLNVNRPDMNSRRKAAVVYRYGLGYRQTFDDLPCFRYYNMDVRDAVELEWHAKNSQASKQI